MPVFRKYCSAVLLAGSRIFPCAQASLEAKPGAEIKAPRILATRFVFFSLLFVSVREN
jgi:hypothetical protein